MQVLLQYKGFARLQGFMQGLAKAWVEKRGFAVHGFQKKLRFQKKV